MRLSLLLLLGASSVSSVGAQQTLSLQDAIALAQRRGPQAQIARTERDAARYRNDSFNAALLPQMRLSGDAANLYHGFTAIPAPDGSSSYVSQAQNQSTLGLAIDQRVPLTGGTVTFGSEVSRLDLFGNNSLRQYQTTPFYVSLQQDLFKPRNLVWDERDQSLSATVAERAYLEAREDVAANVAGAFFDLYAAEMSLANAMANQSVNDTLYTLNKGRYEVGKIGENDLLKSELQLLRARASVDDARLQRDRAEAALRRQLVIPDGEPLKIVAPDSIPNVDADPDVAVRESLRNASVTQQNALDETRAKRALTTATLANRFNATLAATVGFDQRATALGQAYQSPLGRQALQLGINMPMIQWGAGRGQVEAAKADLQTVQFVNRTRHDALAEDARFSALQLQQAQRNVVLAAKADTVSAKQFEVARNRYTIGKISNTDLYNAQTDKDLAVLSYVQALRSYWTAYYHLRRVTLYDFATKSELAEAPR